jgi:hypothetical protein
MMANARAERLLKIPAEPSPELRIPGAAAQTGVVSLAGTWLGSWESALDSAGVARASIPAEILAYTSCVSPTPQLEREESPEPEFGWIPANLCDLSKG